MSNLNKISKGHLRVNLHSLMLSFSKLFPPIILAKCLLALLDLMISCSETTSTKTSDRFSVITWLNRSSDSQSKIEEDWEPLQQAKPQLITSRKCKSQISTARLMRNLVRKSYLDAQYVARISKIRPLWCLVDISSIKNASLNGLAIITNALSVGLNFLLMILTTRD